MPLSMLAMEAHSDEALVSHGILQQSVVECKSMQLNEQCSEHRMVPAIQVAFNVCFLAANTAFDMGVTASLLETSNLHLHFLQDFFGPTSSAYLPSCTAAS